MKKPNIFKTLKNIYDPFLKRIPDSLSKRYVKKELERAAGLETQLQNPDDLLNSKGKGLELFDTMMLDETISGTIDLKKTLILSVDGNVQSPSDDGDALERADFLDTMLQETMKPNIWDLSHQMLDSMIYGFKCGEIVYEIGKEGIYKNKWIIKGVKPKHSKLFDFDYDEYGDLNKLYIGYYYGGGRNEDNTITGIDNILDKFLIMVWPYQKDGNWYGQSDLSYIYTNYYTKYYIYRYRGSFIQNFGQPFIEVIYDFQKTSTEDKDAIKEELDNFQDNKYILNPALRDKKNPTDWLKKFDINYHEPKSTSTAIHETAIQNINNDMRRRLLIPDNVGYSTQQVGSLAKAQTEFNVLVKVIRECHGKLEDLYNPLIKKIEKWNFGEQENYCELKFQDIDKRIETELLRALIDQKVIDPREKWIRQYIGIPSITVEEAEEIAEKKKEDIEEARQSMINQTGQQNPFAAKEQDKEIPEQTKTPKINEKTEPQKEYEAEKKEMQAKQIKPPTNFDRIKKTLNDAESNFIDYYNEVHKQNENHLINQVKRKYDLKSYSWIDSLKINKTELKKLLIKYYFDLYFSAKEEAIKEIKNKVRIPEKYTMQEDNILDEDAKDIFESWKKYMYKEYGTLGVLTREDAQALRALREKAFLATGDEEKRILKEMTTMLRSSIDNQAPLNNVTSQLQTQLSEDRQQYAHTIARTNAVTSYNTGRIIEFQSELVKPMIAAYQFQAVLDDNTTPVCAAHDGQIISKDDPQLKMWWPPLHYNCRSIMTPIMIDDIDNPNSYYYDYKNKTKEFPTWGTNVPEGAIQPAKGFGGIK